MNPNPIRKIQPPRGFALIVTLSLMILLVVIAVGLLSLSTITLRTVGHDAAAVARANARLSLMIALGELQKTVGDDRRVTVDGSIYDGAANPRALGVWQSWSPNLANNPLGNAPSYDSFKTSNFVSWLTSSSQPTDLESSDWARSGTLPEAVELFTELSDGFELEGGKINVPGSGSGSGTMAWSVVQEATKAKVNVGGPEDADHEINDELQAQARPSLATSSNFSQPTADWNTRSGKVISMPQATLDPNLWKGGSNTPENEAYTTQGFGLLTDVVNGGLKTDLSLGFELPDSDFTSSSLGKFKNPFNSANVPQFTTPPNYDGQRPLFAPVVTSSGSVRVDLSFDPANTSFEFPAAAVPTFETLRSFWRTPFHMYTTADGPTIFERGMDHVALRQSSGTYPSPAAPPPAQATQTGYRPVLDRVLYMLSVGAGATDRQVRLIMTPIITLWNPYNVALEIEGAVAYPWMDVPFQTQWRFYQNGTAENVREEGLANMMGAQFINANPSHGRSVNPYFYACITPPAGSSSIRFKPGEVRVFAPSSQTVKDYRSNFPIRERRIVLSPVTTPQQLSSRGGLAIPMKNSARSNGFTRNVDAGTTVELTISPSTGSNYPFSVTLEDATRIKLANPSERDRGQAIADVQTVNFSLSGSTTTMRSPLLSYADLMNPNRKPFGVIETYHRVASDTRLYRRSDLVYTTNPRQPYINRYLTNGNFLAAPHYETRMQGGISDIANVLQTTNGGRNAFYGATNSSSTGESELSFFEVPQSPLLSLAGFQHADLSSSPYAPANQFGNSWASAYLSKSVVAAILPRTSGGQGQATYTRAEMPVYDHSYLTNEALWDSFFCSGASSDISPGSGGGGPSVWANEIANVTRDYRTVLSDFVTDPQKNPLRNSRMRLQRGDVDLAQLTSELLAPEGYMKIAAHLTVDGAFNINSTSEEAWAAFLSGMRDRNFDVRNGSAPSNGQTAFPRFRNPMGTDTNNWQGFRALSDGDISQLARNIVVEVKKRGPFLSLGEFVNRRVENTEKGLKGAIQAAIDATSINQSALYDGFDVSGYPAAGRSNLSPPRSGVGIPGYLTQADVLQSLAPVMTARSDTFTVRGYGEAKDKSGKILAVARCEAVVQRNPEFVDPSDSPYTSIADLNTTNQTFGRRFSIVSFRYLANNEVRTDPIP